MFQDHKDKNGLLIGFLSGAVVGAVVGLLYAPKSGKKMRRALNNKAQDIMDDAEDLLKTTKKRTSEAVHEGKKMAEQLVSDTKAITDSLLKDATQVISDAKVLVSDVIKTGKDTLSV